MATTDAVSPENNVLGWPAVQAPEVIYSALDAQGVVSGGKVVVFYQGILGRVKIDSIADEEDNCDFEENYIAYSDPIFKQGK